MKKIALSLMCLMGMASSLPALACSNLSGRYIHAFEESDFRKEACLSVAQSDCNTITVSDWSTTMKDGRVDVVDMTKFPPRVFSVAEANDWFPSGSTWHRAAAGECAR